MYFQITVEYVYEGQPRRMTVHTVGRERTEKMKDYYLSLPETVRVWVREVN